MRGVDIRFAACCALKLHNPIQASNLRKQETYLDLNLRLQLRYWDTYKHGGCICSLGYFPFQPVVHKYSIKGCGMCCAVCGKVHTKDALLLIEKRSLCGSSRFPLKKIVTMTISLTSNRQ